MKSQYLIALYIVFVTTAHRAGNGRGFDFLATGLWYDHKCGCRGGTGGPDPPGKSQVIWVSIGNKQLDPPPWKKLAPTGKCWIPSGTLKNDRFLRN